jgi:hypothetical protein
VSPFQSEADTDWAHLDQTVRQNPYWCIQGQVVLADTTACFRCSPRSHLVYEELLEISGISSTNTSNWCKFSEPIVPQVRKRVLEAGGQWQVPVRSRKGSMILWFSSTVHSAMIQTKERATWANKNDPWADWRFVVYTCYRPKFECNVSHFSFFSISSVICLPFVTYFLKSAHAERLQTCLNENRVSNHSGDKIFPKIRSSEHTKYEVLFFLISFLHDFHSSYTEPPSGYTSTIS